LGQGLPLSAAPAAVHLELRNKELPLAAMDKDRPGLPHQLQTPLVSRLEWAALVLLPNKVVLVGPQAMLRLREVSAPQLLHPSALGPLLPLLLGRLHLVPGRQLVGSAVTAGSVPAELLLSPPMAAVAFTINKPHTADKAKGYRQAFKGAKMATEIIAP
jgi:hypothetical protein